MVCRNRPLTIKPYPMKIRREYMRLEFIKQCGLIGLRSYPYQPFVQLLYTYLLKQRK